MADPKNTWSIRPAAVEIMPVDEVAAITARHDELINSLERELVVALQEADAAEARLREHPAARVIDDDFEAFVIWATESQVVEISRDDAHPESPPAAPMIDVESRIAPTPRPPADPPTVLATPVAAPTPDSAPPRAGRTTGRTTVVSRPGSTPPPPPVAPAVAPAPPAATQAPAPTEKFWDDGRTNGSSRASRLQRDRGRIASLPSTLMLQAGAVIVIVALLVLKLG